MADDDQLAPPDLTQMLSGSASQPMPDLGVGSPQTLILAPQHSFPIFEATVDGANRINGLQEFRPSYVSLPHNGYNFIICETKT